MKHRAKFTHWSGDNYALTAMFKLPNGTRTTIASLEKTDNNVDQPPEYTYWLDQTKTKKRCGYCWMMTRTLYDRANHYYLKHGLKDDENFHTPNKGD